MRNEGIDDVFVKTMRKKLEKLSHNELIRVADSHGVKLPVYSTENEIIEKIIFEMRRGKPQKYYAKSDNLNNKKQVKIYRRVIPKISSLFIFFVVFLVFAAFLVLVFRPQKHGFCDNGYSSSKCHLCPSHAECVNGKAQCSEDYELLEGRCIVKDDDSEVVSKVLSLALKGIHDRAGCFLCGTAKKDFYTVDQLDSFIYGENIVNASDFPRIFAKVLNHLDDDVEVAKHTHEKEKIYVSLAPNKPTSCVFNRFMAASILAYFLVVFLFIVFRQLYRLYKELVRKNKIASYQAGLVIKEMQSYVTEIDSLSLKERFKGRQDIDISMWNLIEENLKLSPYIIWRKKGGIYFFLFIKKY